MIHLCAIVDESAAEQEIARALERVSPEPGIDVLAHTEVWPGAGVKLLVHAFEGERALPSASADGRVQVFAVGHIVANERVVPAAGPVLEHWVRHGDDRWDERNGQFTAIVRDVEQRRLVVVNDRFGHHPLYCARRGSRIALASQLQAISALDRGGSLASEAVAEVLVVGHLLGDTAPLAGVEVLPPGAIVRVERGALEVRRYWRARFEAGPPLPTGRLSELLARAVSRTCSDRRRRGLLLSGGLDSRLLCHEAKRHDSTLHAYTFGDGDSGDIAFAREVARVVDVDWRPLPGDVSRWREAISTCVRQSDGAVPFHHLRTPPFHDEIKERCDVLLSGTSGDMLFGSAVVGRRPTPSSIDEVARLLRARFLGASRSARALLRPDFESFARKHLDDALGATLADNPHRTRQDLLDSWNLEQRQRRFIFMGPASNRYRFANRAPFYDYDLVDAALRLPLEQRRNQQLYVEALWQLMPALRNVPWQKTGYPPNPHRLPRLIARVRRRANRVLRRSAPTQESMDIDRLVRAAFTRHELLAELCDGGPRWHDFVDVDALRAAVDAHFDERARNGALLCTVLTIARAEQLFTR